MPSWKSSAKAPRQLLLLKQSKGFRPTQEKFREKDSRCTMPRGAGISPRISWFREADKESFAKKMVSSDFMQLHHIKPAILTPTRGSPQTK
jgi:hypothetical protein